MKVSARRGGFTLIELVVIITILGILAAFAIPRFMSLEARARMASRDSLAGSLRWVRRSHMRCGLRTAALRLR